MKIVHIVFGRAKPESSNGVVKSVYYLAKYQTLLGHKTDILSIRSKPRMDSISYMANMTNHFFEKQYIRFVLDRKLLSYLNDNKGEIDIVHFHSAYQPEYWRISKQLNCWRINYIISPRGSYQKYANQKSYFKKRIYKYFIEKKIINNAKAVHALNRSEANEIIEYGVEPSKVFILPNGIDFSVLPEGISSKKRDNLPDNQEKRIIYCGRIDVRAKGLDILIKSLSMLKKKSKSYNYRLTIMGPDWQNNSKQLQKLISQYNVNNEVDIIGPKYGIEKYKALAASDIFVLVSRSEGMPTSVLEAMSFGIPCVLTAETNIGKLAEDRGACVFVSLDPESLSDTLCSLLHNNSLLEVMGHNASKYVVETFNYNKIADAMCQNYLKNFDEKHYAY